MVWIVDWAKVLQDFCLPLECYWFVGPSHDSSPCKSWPRQLNSPLWCCSAQEPSFGAGVSGDHCIAQRARWHEDGDMSYARHVCMHAYIHTYRHIHTYAYTRIHMYIYMHMYVYMDFCFYMHLHICTYIYIRAYTPRHIWTHTHIHT